MAPARSGIPDEEWDAELQRQGGHVLQSRAWMRVQEALGYPTLWSSGTGWSWAAAIGQRPGLRHLYVPQGPTAASRPDLDEAVAGLREAAAARSLHLVRLEPQVPGVGAADLEALGARRAPAVQPEHTWVVDLDRGESELRSQLSATHRRRINAAQRQGLAVRSSREPTEIDTFIALVRHTGHGGFRPQSDRYYRTLADILMPPGMATLYLAEAAGRPVAAVLGLDFGDTRYYAHAASDGTGRRLNAGPPLAWRMILEARAAGRRHFDFWGVLPAPVEGHPWSGFTRFKQGFGGRLVTRCGTWELPLSPGRHALLRLLRLLHRVSGARGRAEPPG